ncbi:MAG: hypothetical protein R6U13_14405, partial [Desulfatiglandaceae bacterium]
MEALRRKEKKEKQEQRGADTHRHSACGACWWGRGAAVLVLVAPAARVSVSGEPPVPSGRGFTD